MNKGINKRLLACASFVRDGAVLGDIGTDHGYLPIYLLDKHKIQFAYLSDVNKGPLSKAEANAKAAGLYSKVKLCLCDGAAELEGMGITDYTIAGMGGELIASIIDSAEHIKDSSLRLILQPMSKPEILRAYLFENGFSVECEKYVFDEGKYYVCFLSKYTGERVKFCASDAYFGTEEKFFSAVSDDMLGYMNEREKALVRMIEGKSLGGADTKSDEALLFELRRRLEKMKNNL